MKRLFYLLLLIACGMQAQIGGIPTSFSYGIKLPNAVNSITIDSIPLMDGDGVVNGYITKAQLQSDIGTTIPNGTGFLKNDGIGTWTYDNSTYAIDGNVVHKTGAESITGQKTFTNTGASRNIYSKNQSTGRGIWSENQSTGQGIYSTSNSTGQGIYSYNSFGGTGIYSDNDGTGVGIYSQINSTGHSIISNSIGPSSTGFVYVGQSDGVNTFTVTKEGDVTANSFIKTGGLSTEFLKADGSVDSSTYLTSFTETDPTVPVYTKGLTSATALLNEIKTVNGAGSGLDADLLDGLNSTQFLRSDVADTKTVGGLTFNDNIDIRLGAGADSQLFFDATNTRLRLNAGDFKIQNEFSTDRFTFGRTTGDFTATGTGKFGTGGGYALELESTAGSRGIKLLSSDGTYIMALDWNTVDFLLRDTADNPILRINASSKKATFYGNSSFVGNVGIGITNPLYKLDVSGTGRFTGDVTATNFILSSDERLKNNIEEVKPKTIKTDWKTFELNSEKGQKRYGVIAQELEKEHPEFVRTADDGYKSVAYIDLLIAKIVELEARIKKLEDEK